MSYFDVKLDLNWEEHELKETIHKFAKEVVRPIARELDQMTAEEGIAPDSPVWDYLRQAYALGFHKAELPEAVGGLGFSPLQSHILKEELAWGSFGLASLITVAAMPFSFIAHSGNLELIEQYVKPFCDCEDASIIGCWGITEPDHGSDFLGDGLEFFKSPKVKGSVTARLEGDEWVINGQKSSWVSAGTLSTHSMVHVQIDASMGMAGSGICFVPGNLAGVSKGRPLEKLGMRDLNQGEIFFDNVRVPKEYVFIGPEMYTPIMGQCIAHANMNMAIWATGLSRAAFDEAFVHTGDRVQGGKRLNEHPSMQQRLFKMFSRVETARAMSRAMYGLNCQVQTMLPEYSIASKITCTELCLANADDAVQILGGYGLTKEYNTEKLFRDARTSLIMDGTSEVLMRNGGWMLTQTYPRVSQNLEAA